VFALAVPALLVVLVGYAAGASYKRVEQSFGRGAAIAVLLVVVIAVVVWRVRRHRARLGG